MNTLPILYQRLFFIKHILSYFSTIERIPWNTGLVNQKFIRGHLFNVFPCPCSVAFQSHPQAEPLQTVHLRLFFSQPPIHLDHLDQHGRGGREKDDGRCNRQGLQPRCPVSARIAAKMKRSGLWNGLNEFFCDGAFWCPVCLNAWLRTPLPKGYLHCLIGLLFQIPYLKDFIQFQRTCFPVILICSNHCRVPAR